MLNTLLSSISFSFGLDDIDTYSIVIGGSVIIILSYFANVLAKRTNIPSVLVLIAMGIGIRQGLTAMDVIAIPFQDQILELLGTVGLIFILLEAALDLELSKKKLPLILKSASLALLALGISSIAIAAFFTYVLAMDSMTAIVYAIPLSIMSSAIIIPSVGGLSRERKEFMVYESTFSDIWGIMAFYILLENHDATSGTEVVLAIGKNIGGSFIISIVVSYLLVYVLQKIKSSVKLFLSIAVLLLIYSVQKLLHLSPLILILIFGLMLNNYKIFFPRIFQNQDGESWLGSLLNEAKMSSLRHDFHVLTLESAFVIRTFFFVMFGATVALASLANWEVVFYGLVISVILYIVRFILLYLFRRKDPTSLLYIAPRGLITILLFFHIVHLSSDPDHPQFVSEAFDPAILLVVILVTSIVMTISLIQQGSGLKEIKIHEGHPLLSEEDESNDKKVGEDEIDSTTGADVVDIVDDGEGEIEDVASKEVGDEDVARKGEADSGDEDDEDDDDDDEDEDDEDEVEGQKS
jgi:Kef-type K+ transport system membrane component KefB